MKILTAVQVKQMITDQPDIKLVMTLGPNSFAKCHIPGSLNIWDIETAKKEIPRNSKVIVYCSDTRCMASYYAYQQLEEAGYTQIWRFAGGLLEWDDLGYELTP